MNGGLSGKFGINWRSAKGCEGPGGCGVSTWRYQGTGSDEIAEEAASGDDADIVLSVDVPVNGNVSDG
jgi:hypothetical protein